jgi:hypothetical protein
MGRRVFLILVLTAAVLKPALAYDDGDFQVWNTEVEEWKINDNSRLALEEEIRFADDASDFHYYHFDLGYAYDVNKYLTLGLNYRQVYDKKDANSKFRQENRPHINAILKYTLAGFQLDDRNRLEYRHFGYQTDSFRYRNKFTVKFPWKFTPFKIQPYLADEIFIPLNGINLNRNRFYAGFGLTFFKNLKGELYYLLQTSKSSGTCTWKNANVLGTKIKLVF